jgi:hypothetical protein
MQLLGGPGKGKIANWASKYEENGAGEFVQNELQIGNDED